MSARAAGALLALVLALTGAAPALALDATGEAFNRLEKKTMCIACNVPLNIAEAPQADATRAQIRLLLDRGLSEDEVLDQLVEEYGENVLASPKAEGISTLAYAVPIGSLLGLLGLGAVLLPRWRRTRGAGVDAETAARRPGEDDDGPAGELSDEDRRRLEADLLRSAG